MTDNKENSTQKKKIKNIPTEKQNSEMEEMNDQEGTETQSRPSKKPQLRMRMLKVLRNFHRPRKGLEPYSKQKISECYQIYTEILEPFLGYRNPPLQYPVSDYNIFTTNCSPQQMPFMNNLTLCIAIGAQISGQLDIAKDLYYLASERAREQFDLFCYENACTFMAQAIYLNMQNENAITDISQNEDINDMIINHLTTAISLTQSINGHQFQQDIQNMLCLAYTIRLRIPDKKTILEIKEIEKLKGQCIYAKILLTVVFAENVVNHKILQNAEQAKSQLIVLLDQLRSSEVKMLSSLNVYWHTVLCYGLLSALCLILKQTETALHFSRIATESFEDLMKQQHYFLLHWQQRGLKYPVDVHFVCNSYVDMERDIKILEMVQSNSMESFPLSANRLLSQLKNHNAQYTQLLMTD